MLHDPLLYSNLPVGASVAGYSVDGVQSPAVWCKWLTDIPLEVSTSETPRLYTSRSENPASTNVCIMSTSASAMDSAAGESSAAQQLLQKHAEVPHPVTVEEAEDEDLPHKTDSATTSGKASETKPASKLFDAQSHELFPELGAPKGKAANVAPIWGAKNNAGNKANGVNASAAPAPVSGNAPSSQRPTPSMFIPGRNVETVTLEPQYIIPRNQLKRPIPDIIKDINRKSRANITMATSSNGRLKFDATGPQDVAQQALKDLVQQIGTKVR